MKHRRLLASALAAAAAITFSAMSVFAAGAELDAEQVTPIDVTEQNLDTIDDLDDMDSAISLSPAEAETTAIEAAVALDESGINELNAEDDFVQEPLAANAVPNLLDETAANDLPGAEFDADSDTQPESAVYSLSDAHYLNRIIGYFEESTTPILQPLVLRAGDLLKDGQMAAGARYEWTSPQAQAGTTNNFISTDQDQLIGRVGSSYSGVFQMPGFKPFCEDYTAQFKVRAYLDGVAESSVSKTFTVKVTDKLTPFTLEAMGGVPDFKPTESDLVGAVIKNSILQATPDYPVTLTANVDLSSTDFLRNALWPRNSSVTIQPGHVRWMVVNNYSDGGASVSKCSSGRFVETSDGTTHTLELRGSAYGEQKVFYCVVDYEYDTGSEVGLIEYHSNPIAVHLPAVPDASVLPKSKDWYEWGLVEGIPSEPGTMPSQSPETPTEPTASAVPSTSEYFQLPPLTQEQCVAAYKELVEPYRDWRNEKDPFALKPPEMNADGTLSAESQNELLGLVNFIRRCAGVNNISIDPAKSNYAQSGAEYNSRNNTLGHYGAQNDQTVEGRKANHALTHSNVSYGSVTGSEYEFTELLRNQFREDNGTNWPGLGHRRWLLDNRTLTMGFGYATGHGHGEHLLTYIKDDAWNNGFGMNATRQGLQAFPGSGAFPVELMDCKAWSLTVGNDGWTIPDDGVAVKVVRDEGTTAEYAVDLMRVERNMAWSSKGDIFTVDSTQAGSGPIVTFSPGSMYPSGNVWNGRDLTGHTYTIHVSGLKQKSGLPAPEIVYSTHFFSMASALAGQAKPVVTAVPVSSPPASQEPTPTLTPTLEPSPILIPEPTQQQIVLPSADNSPILPSAAVEPTSATNEPSAAPVSPSFEIPMQVQTPVPSQKPAESVAGQPSQGPTAQTTPKPTKAPSPVLSAVQDNQDAHGGENSAAIVSVTGKKIAVAKPQQNGTPTTVADVLSALSATGGTIEVRSVTGDSADKEAPVATGMMVYAYDDDGMLTDIYPIIVPFDVLGTGTMSLSQLTRLAGGFTGTEPLHGIYLDAAAQTKPGVVTLSDLVKAAHLLIQGQTAQSPSNHRG